MACKCVCTCPLEAGDKIRYKLDPDSSSQVRLNGALDLYLAYLGTEYVIYTWQTRKDRQGRAAEGEGFLTRAEFDRKIERDPDA